MLVDQLLQNDLPRDRLGDLDDSREVEVIPAKARPSPRLAPVISAVQSSTFITCPIGSKQRLRLKTLGAFTHDLLLSGAPDYSGDDPPTVGRNWRSLRRA
jgi:hypothetical protein